MRVQTPLFAVSWRKEPGGQFHLKVTYGGPLLLMAIFAVGYVVGKGGL